MLQNRYKEKDHFDTVFTQRHWVMKLNISKKVIAPYVNLVVIILKWILIQD